MFFFMRTRLLLYNIDRIHGIFKINYFEYLLSLETVSGERYFNYKESQELTRVNPDRNIFSIK